MPSGARLQFRYGLRLVALGLKDRIRDNKLVGTDACIAYLDTSKPDQIPEIAPVRAANLVMSEVQGDFCVLEFALAGFAYAQDLGAFNRQIRAQNGNLPAWRDGAVAGHFCEEVTASGLPIKFDADVGEWQQICKRLSVYPGYQAERVFYRLEGVHAANSGTAVPCKDAAFQLRSGELYDARLLHYSPAKLVFPAQPENKDLNWLLADADDKTMTFVGAKALAVDSDYDRKIVRFRAATTTVPLDARLSFSRRAVGATKLEEGTWDFDLHARIRPRRWTQTWQGLLIGAPVAIQGVVLTLASDKIANPALIAVLLGLGGLVSGLLATFLVPRKA